MQRLLQPSILTLSLAVPTASLALGLGDIRVESALHQPLVAQIELIGAADDELGRLSAAIASDELFEHYNLERAPFIYGTTLSVGRDAQGRPVLNMRSTEKFTEPVVTLLVDLHTPHGELVREYTLFLDPAGLVDSGGALSSARAVSNTGIASASNTNTAPAPTADAATSVDAASTAPAAPASAAKATRSERSAPGTAAQVASTIATAASGSASSKSLGQTYKVSRRDTLDRIVTATGARSRIERHRMMIAIFRNNPAAFQNNFNRMHSGVTLTFPTAEQLAAISVEETNREYDAQMAAWHSSRSASTGTQPASASASGETTGESAAQSGGGTVAGRSAKVVDGDRREGSAAARAAVASIAASADPETLPTDPAALKQRIASLEQSLAQVQQQLKQPLPAPPNTPVTALADHAASDTTADVTASASSATAPAASAPVTPVAAAVRTALRDSNASSIPTTDEANSEDAADETPAPRHHLVELISAAIGTAAVFLAGAWFFFRRRTSYNSASPKYGTASARPIEVEESNDLVDFAATTASVAQMPAPGESAIANAPAASDKASREPKGIDEDSEQRANKDSKNESSWFEDSFSTPIADLLNDPTITLPVDDTEILPVDPAEPTLKLPANAADQAAETEVLVAPDLQFTDPNTEHVVMGSALNETRPVERRKNPVDVLRQAIEREPDRSDLRLKLLELYYSAAAENRRAFLEASRQLSKSENLATPEDWSRIADMGRIIAPDDELFSSEGDVDDKRVA